MSTTSPNYITHTETYTIAGLGNPGNEYEKSRHNAGRMVLEVLREKYGDAEWKSDTKSKSLTAKTTIGKATVLLLCPDNYMNRSGRSIAYFVKSKKAAQRLVVVYDDMDLPVGHIRVSHNRGSGGHRGLDSVIKALKTREFTRVRVGVTPTTITGKLKKPKSSNESAVHSFLLKPLSGKDERSFRKGIRQAAEAVEMIITDGHVAAMNAYN